MSCVCPHGTGSVRFSRRAPPHQDDALERAAAAFSSPRQSHRSSSRARSVEVQQQLTRQIRAEATPQRTAQPQSFHRIRQGLNWWPADCRQRILAWQASAWTFATTAPDGRILPFNIGERRLSGTAFLFLGRHQSTSFNSNRRNAPSTRSISKRTHLGLSLRNGIRLSAIQLSTQRHETDAAFATAFLLTNREPSAAGSVAGTVLPCISWTRDTFISVTMHSWFLLLSAAWSAARMLAQEWHQPDGFSQGRIHQPDRGDDVAACGEPFSAAAEVGHGTQAWKPVRHTGL